MFWVVQNNIRDEASYESFIQALRDLNVEYAVVKVIPFSHECIPEISTEGQRIVAFGSTTLDLVAKRNRWEPGTFLNENHDQRVWSKAYGDNMLNADAEYFEFCKVPAFDGSKFIRPVEDMKVFAGAVIHGTELAHWQGLTLALADDFSTLTPKTVVSVSSVKEITTETRFFVVSGKVVAGSIYRLNGQLHYERRTEDFRDDWQFAQRMVDLWQPAEAFVLDIAFTMDEDWTNPAFKVIEVNCINSSGFYSADMRPVVEAIEKL
jgi:hypothetical protein